MGASSPNGVRVCCATSPDDQRGRRLDRLIAADGLRGACCRAVAPIFAVLGDGTFGFHMAEIETAVRLDLPYVAIVGTDARWNAEYNLQVRDYGPNRTHGCELNPRGTIWSATALGGHGELVEAAAALPGAIERALASGKPAVVNVMIESIPSPVVRR